MGPAAFSPGGRRIAERWATTRAPNFRWSCLTIFTASLFCVSVIAFAPPGSANGPHNCGTNSYSERHIIAYCLISYSVSVATEVILGHGYSFSCDCWSLGVIIFACLYGWVSGLRVYQAHGLFNSRSSMVLDTLHLSVFPWIFRSQILAKLFSNKCYIFVIYRRLRLFIRSCTFARVHYSAMSHAGKFWIGGSPCDFHLARVYPMRGSTQWNSSFVSPRTVSVHSPPPLYRDQILWSWIRTKVALCRCLAQRKM